MKPDVSRRRFVKTGAAATTILSAPWIRKGANAQGRKTLKIVQWNHFVPRFDNWFLGTWVKEWGEKNDTSVTVENVGMSSLRSRALSQIEGQTGCDIFMFLSPPPLFEDHVIDHREIYEECESRYGKPLDIATHSTYNPRTRKYYGFSDSYVPDPINYRADLWEQIDMFPDTWDDIRKGSRLIRQAFGIPAGFGLAPELDSNMGLRSLLASFGASIQDADGNPAFRSKAAVDAFNFTADFYQESMTDEVFTWDPSSNNRMMLAGRGSAALNAISITRTGENQKIPIHASIHLAPPAEGPVRRIGLYHLLDVYCIWNFARNIEGAKQFLVDYVGASRDIFLESEFYNFPCFPQLVPDLAELVSDDAKARPRDKYKLFENVTDWTTNAGYPGFANAATDEIFSDWILSNAMADVARGKMSAEEAVDLVDKKARDIFAHWRERGKV